jgi:serine/threonine protein kinase
VLLNADGHILLTDFGLSKVALTTTTVCGTPEFTAPEILDERGHYDKTVDFWSMGVMLYDMLVGHPPWTGHNRKKIMEGIMKKKPLFPFFMTSFAKELCTKVKNPKSEYTSIGRL